MTLISEIITSAYREANLISLGASLTAEQTAEALPLLLRIIESTLGNEVGEHFTVAEVGLEISTITNYRDWLDQTEPLQLRNNQTINSNTHIFLNQESPQTFKLPRSPRDGARLRITDIGNKLSQFPITIEGNGRKIEGQTELVLSVDNLISEWFYRADSGQWLKSNPLALSSVIPFPSEFDDFFIIALAMRLNPRHNQQSAPETVARYQNIRNKLRARYRQSDPQYSEYSLWSTGQRRYYSSYAFDEGY